MLFFRPKPPPPLPAPPPPSSASIPAITSALVLGLFVPTALLCVTSTKVYGKPPRLGDVANVFVLVNTALFVLFALADYVGIISWASASYHDEGFCVANKSTLLDSHMMSFYVDTITALILGALAKRHAEHPGVKGAAVELAGAGIFSHGLGHLSLWAGHLPTTGESLAVQRLDGAALATQLAIRLPLLFGFFFALFKSAPNMSKRDALLHTLPHTIVLSLLVPPRLSFTYVQTALLWGVTGNDLQRTAKDRYYDLNALLVNVPVGLVSWAEAIGCDAFFKAMGGHVWYDGSIPLSMFAYYAVVLNS